MPGPSSANARKPDNSHIVFSNRSLIAHLSSQETADRVVATVASALASGESKDCPVGRSVSSQDEATGMAGLVDEDQFAQGWEAALAKLLATARQRVSAELGGRVLSIEEMGLLLGPQGPRIASEEPEKFADDAVGFLVHRSGGLGWGSHVYAAEGESGAVPPSSISLEVLSREDWLVSMAARGAMVDANAARARMKEDARIASGLTALAVAAMKADVDEVARELGKGGDPRQTDHDGLSALDYARMRAQAESDAKPGGSTMAKQASEALWMIHAAAEAMDLSDATAAAPARKGPRARI